MRTSSSATLFTARTAGILYLAIIGLGLFGEAFVRGSLVVGGDAAATADNILGAQQLWRIGMTTDIVMHVLDVPLIVFFYLLLKPISHPLALFATVLNVVQTCVLAINKLNLVAALSLLNSSALAARQFDSQALAYLAVDLHSDGFGIGLIFFGLACLVRGYLVLKSTYVPHVLGAMLGLAGMSYLVNSFALLLSPSVASILFPAVLLPALVAELAFSLWLISTNEAKLQQRLSEHKPLESVAR
jgi:hypothetical protein